MLHGEVEETVDVVLDGLRGQVRDEEGEHVFALLRGHVVDRRLVMVAVVAVILIVHLGLLRLLLELLLLLLKLLLLKLLLLRVVMVVMMMVVVIRARERCDSHRAGEERDRDRGSWCEARS